MNASEAIKKVAKQAGLTQMELAEKIGATQSSVAMFLKRETSMKLENLMKMANACGYDVVLVDRKDPKQAYVIGEHDTIDFGPGDEAFDARIREIVADEIEKRERSPQVVVTNRIPKK